MSNASGAAPARAAGAAEPAQVEPAEPRGRLGRGGWLAVAFGTLLVACCLSLLVGAEPLAPGAVWEALLHGANGTNGAAGASTADEEAAAIVRDARVPRTALALLVGAALGLAGAVIQALTRNPLADPGILGVNAGAGFGVVLGVALLGITAIGQYLWCAFLGAIVATAVVYLIGGRGPEGTSPARLTLAGLALGAVLQGVSSGITLLDRDLFDTMRYWEAGNIANRPTDTLVTVAPCVLAGVMLALALAGPLNAVALGEDLARSLGTNLTLVRVGVVVAVTLLCGAATAAAGPIGFVGLMVPHAVRWLVGPDQRWILPFTLVLAPVLLLVADILGRVVLPSGELQVGVVTAFVGAPVLIWLVRRERASAL